MTRRFPAFALLAIQCATPVLAHDGGKPRNEWLALGDMKLSETPERGRILACDTRFGGGGAHATGPWMRDGKWNPSLKPVVQGSIEWPNAAISVSLEGGRRIVRANNLPSHPTGQYPVDPDSEAYQYDRNPNTIGEQDILLDMPAMPQRAEKPACLPMGMVGFALSGVAIFNAFDGAGRDAPAYEILDSCNGHPERTGQYHYHDWSACLAAEKGDQPVGFMLDGFPILPPVDSKGHEWTTADLDACHGTTGPVTIDGRTQDMYHYRFTRDFPYTISCFSGVPVR